MSGINRREFLKRASSTVGAAAVTSFLSACGAKDTPAVMQVTGSPTPTPFKPLSESIQPTQGQLKPDPSELMNRMAVVRNGEPEELVRKALDVFGGIQTFVRPGANVIIKPNICVSYRAFETAATTNPWIVGALVKVCLEAGAGRVRVMDTPFDGSALDAYAFSGIQQQVEANGGQMELMSSIKYMEIDLPQALDLHSTYVYDEVLNADVLFNVPIAKDHGLAKLTIGMKNLLGVVKNRPAFHNNLGQRLADLSSRIRPALTLVDAVRILTYGGPTGGDPAAVQKLDTVIASPDIVATDAYAATLFGLRGDDLEYVRAGAAMGLGKSDLAQMKIEEVNLAA
jgi:uncharacterized protein (DUF362 family)